MELLEKLLPNAVKIPDEIWQATVETIFMTVVSGLIAGVIGLGIGVLLVVTRPNGILERPKFFNVTDKLVNVFRSIPFVILLALIVPLTRLLTGTTIGTVAALVPLVAGTIPFFARQVEIALLEVNPGVVEAAEAMGTAPRQIITRVYLREGLPGLIRVSAMTIISLINLTAMAGTIGGGGLGNLAIAKGYNRYQTDVTLVATLIILILVFISQAVANWLVKKVSH